jgi:hypothetical protein
MRISGTLVLIALAALTMMAGCATSSSGQTQSGAAPTVTSAGQDQASPFNQPLMATGGDLVMLRIVSRAIAG